MSECEHGHLRRSCRICELESELAENKRHFENSFQSWLLAEEEYKKDLAAAQADAERYRLALFMAGIDPDAKPHPCDGDAPDE